MAIVSLNPLAELYFHGRITREDAEELLRDGPNGKFLLRSREVVNAGVDIFIVSVSFESQVLHYSVDRRPDGTYNIPGGKQFIGPVEIVRYHMTSQDGIKTSLNQPVNRPPELGAVVYWGLTTDIVETELYLSGGLSRDAARDEVFRIFANSLTNKPTRFREFLRQMQYSRPWFHGTAGREEAEQRLATYGMRSGTFLIRRKKDCFVLSVIHDRLFKHYLIRERQSGPGQASSPSSPSSPIVGGSTNAIVCGYGMDGGPLFSSLIELVHWYHAYSDGLPCALLFPCPNAQTLEVADHPAAAAYLGVAAHTNGHAHDMATHVTPVQRSRSKSFGGDSVAAVPPTKLVSVVDDFLPSSNSAAEQMSPPEDTVVVRNRVKAPSKYTENGDNHNETGNHRVIDDELAKKLDAIALEISVAQPGQKQPEINNPNKILISVQRPAVAVRPTPVIPMCKPASTPIPADPPSLKESHHQQDSFAKAGSPTAAGPKPVVTKRVIRLPQALARKGGPEPTAAASAGLSNSGLTVSTRRQNESHERAPSPVKQATSPTTRTVSPPTPRITQQSMKTTLIFDTVQTLASPVTGGVKDDWDEPASGGGDPVAAVAGPPHKSVHMNGGGPTHQPPPHGLHKVNGNGAQNGNGNGNSNGNGNGKGFVEPIILQDSVTRLDPDWLEIHQTIGHGHFGTVLFGYLITPSSRIPVAIKSVRETESRCLENVVKEATTMSNLTHPNIITFFGVCYIETILLVMEYAPLGTLQKFIRANRSFPVIRIVKLMIQVADAMRYLEKNKLVHRDLACRNVLLLSEDQAKVSDFGMSRALDVQRDYYKSQNVGKWPLKWYPPEAIYYWKFDSKTDVWSYGVTLWEATSYGARPYQGMDGWQVLKYIESGKRLDRPPACPPQLYCLMNECWKFKSSERPTFEEVLVTMLDIDCQLAANVASGDVAN